MRDIRKVEWWGAPENFAERKYERKISWLELFYDLVYAAAVSQITHYLSENPTWNTAGFSLLLFCLVFWSWVNGSQYYDLHGSDSIRTRLVTFWQMLAVAAVAITIHDAFEGHQRAFATTFMVLQIMITYLWWSVGYYDPSHRIFNKFYTFNYLISFALFGISLFTSYHLAVVLWVVALLLNMTPSLTGARTISAEMKRRGQVFTASATIVERFGQFTIIVLAESIFATIAGISELRDKQASAWIAFILGILISFLLWALYFDMTSSQETKKGYMYLQALLFLHFPLLASFCVAGACMKVVLGNVAVALPMTLQWMFCVALSVMLLMIVCISGIMEKDEEDLAYIRPVSRMLTGCCVVMLLIPAFGQYLDNISFLSVIAIVLFIPVFTGVRHWVLYKFFSK
ncbi:MAG: hypothetical protein JWQ38_513 [Flavipsychrobacter sp.]|nr:hypothetical protein [Flavipsychrobacter sp.]